MRAVLVVAALGVSTGWAAVSGLARGATPEREPFVPTPAAYDAATVRVAGQMAPAAAQRLRPGGDGYRVVVLLRRADLTTCEDVGRQLREMVRALPGGARVLVWTEPGSRAEVASWVRGERIRPAVVDEIPLAQVVPAVAKAHTPAVLVVRADGMVVDGIAHSQRFPSFRGRSFAQELNLGLLRLPTDTRVTVPEG